MAKTKCRKSKPSQRSPRGHAAAVQTFAQVLDAADQLSPEDQEELIAILHRRLIEAGRQRVLADVRASRREFRAGLCRPATPAEIMREILE